MSVVTDKFKVLLLIMMNEYYALEEKNVKLAKST
jgi:hypothetical protein